MADNLVVVESPAKAETIKRYLGKGFGGLGVLRACKGVAFKRRFSRESSC